MTCTDFFFFNDTATTEIYTLSLHDALPISGNERRRARRHAGEPGRKRHAHREAREADEYDREDRKSTRLNSSHSQISYAVFCLKKKKQVSQDAFMTSTWVHASANAGPHVYA